MKKMVSVLLIVLLGFPIFPALADEAAGEELQAVLLAVKEKIEIPPEFQDFSYSVTQNEKRGNSWRFRWSREEPAYQTITVTADENGEILSYFGSTAEPAGLLSPDYSEKQAAACAEEFLYRVNTTARGRFFVTGVTTGMGIFQVQFEEKVNDIPVKGSSATVCINKADLKITEMSLNRAYRQGNFPEPEQMISAQKAAEIYREQIGFQLIYRTDTDYETKTVKAYPVFVAPKHNTVAVDAFTGQVTDIISEAGYDVVFDAMKQVSAGGSNLRNEAVLTEAELAEIAKAQPLLSKQQAVDIINRAFGEQFVPESAGLNRNMLDEDAYLWNLDLNNEKEKYAYASVDARNGVIFSYSNYQAETAQHPISVEQAENQASALFRENAETIAALYQLNPALSQQTEKSTTLVFHRHEQNIPVEDQTLRVTFNGDGKIESYHLTYHPTTQFVAMKESTDPNTQRIFDAFVQHSGYGLCYIPVTKEGKTELLLTYDFQTTAMPVLEGNTLVPVNYRGEPVKEESAPVYTDLAGHWVEEFVDILSYNNIYLIRENAFLPDRAVTAQEFVSLLSEAINPLPYALRSRIEGVFSGEMVSPEEKELPLTRQAAAKYIVKLLHYEKLAAKPEVLRYPFRDAAAEENQPYITLCYILNIMQGDEAQNFHADEILTRAETAMILYNILK